MKPMCPGWPPPGFLPRVSMLRFAGVLHQVQERPLVDCRPKTRRGLSGARVVPAPIRVHQVPPEAVGFRCAGFAVRSEDSGGASRTPLPQVRPTDRKVPAQGSGTAPAAPSCFPLRALRRPVSGIPIRARNLQAADDLSLQLPPGSLLDPWHHQSIS